MWGRSRSNPKSYVYVPGLARSEVVGNMIDFDRALERFCGSDAYMVNAVEQVRKQFGAIPLIPGRSLRWIHTNNLPKLFGANGILGDVGDNMLAKNAEEGLVKPAAMQLRVGSRVVGPELLPCYSRTYLAQLSNGSGWLPTCSRMTSKDTLYVVGHCSFKGHAMSYKNATREGCSNPDCTRSHMHLRCVDPLTLAGLLVQERLPQSIRQLYLVGCWTGGLDREEQQTVQPYAQRVVAALKPRGYKKLVAIGMTGIANGSTLDATKIDRVDEEGRMVFQHGGRRSGFLDSLRRFM